MIAQREVFPKMFSAIRPLVLASASPRRQDFLLGMGIDCRIVRPPEGAEPLPLPGEAPPVFAARAAKAKAEAVCRNLDAVKTKGAPQAWAVLAADTVVYRDALIFGKPRDPVEALSFLRELKGGGHMVRTACHLHVGGKEGVAFFGEAAVYMADWSDVLLRTYAANGEGLDKAGGYAVQGLGAFLVEKVVGSWSAVIGLPVAETVKALLEQGVIDVAR